MWLFLFHSQANQNLVWCNLVSFSTQQAKRFYTGFLPKIWRGLELYTLIPEWTANEPNHCHSIFVRHSESAYIRYRHLSEMQPPIPQSGAPYRNRTYNMPFGTHVAVYYPKRTRNERIVFTTDYYMWAEVYYHYTTPTEVFYTCYSRYSEQNQTTASPYWRDI